MLLPCNVKEQMSTRCLLPAPARAMTGAKGQTECQWEQAHQLVCGAVQVQAKAVPEQIARHMAELDADLCAPAGQRLARLQQKGNAIPARIVDEQRPPLQRWGTGCKGKTEQ